MHSTLFQLQLTFLNSSRRDEHADTNITMDSRGTWTWDGKFDKVHQTLATESEPEPETQDPFFDHIPLETVNEWANSPVSTWRTPLDTRYRAWDTNPPEAWKWSPIHLFLKMFSPILAIFVEQTNLAALSDKQRKKKWKLITEVEMRWWVACKIQMHEILPYNQEMDVFWKGDHSAAKKLAKQRFKSIEHYLTLCNDPKPPSAQSPWYWKVQPGIDALRQVLRDFIIPGSHLALDESVIKFHGHSIHTFKLSHKPGKQGFVIYAIATHSGLIFDFIVSSSQDGLEGDISGGYINISPRSTRATDPGTQSGQGERLWVSATKMMVIQMCQELRDRLPELPFTVYMDNLFVDVHLAKGLLQMGIGCCGTTRRNARGVPEVMKAMKYQNTNSLGDNQLACTIIDDSVNVTVWNDDLRGNRVSLVSTVHSPTEWEVVARNAAPRYKLRGAARGRGTLMISQPLIAVDYNRYMNCVDNANHLRAVTSIRRGGQRKWTKKFFELFIDTCLVNSYIIWAAHSPNQRAGPRQHKVFTERLIEQLLRVEDKPHRWVMNATRRRCKWDGCQPAAYHFKEPPAKARQSKRQLRGAMTWASCEYCLIPLCINHRNCWKAHHDAEHLPYVQAR